MEWNKTITILTLDIEINTFSYFFFNLHEGLFYQEIEYMENDEFEKKLGRTRLVENYKS